METAGVKVRGLSKRFRRKSGEIVHAIDGLDLDVAQGEFLVLLGPSGCGKTTLLRAIAGVEHADEGRIELGGRPVFDDAMAIAVPPEHRSLGMVFQSYALWPHMTAFDNVAFPLRVRGVSREAMRERVGQLLEVAGVADVARQYPAQMSGGQQQRVALARALVSGDAIVLFDEPLSNVDAKVREQLRAELAALHRRLGFTAIYVTHDQAEAMDLATRIVILDKGRIAQSGTPREIYERPSSHFVASFIGSSNEFDGLISGEDGQTANVMSPIGSINVAVQPGAVATGEAVLVLSRPEDWRVSLERPAERNSWRGGVAARRYRGTHWELAVGVADREIIVWLFDKTALPTQDEVWLSIAPDRLSLVCL